LEIPITVIQQIQTLLSSPAQNTVSKESFNNAQLNTLRSFQLSLEVEALNHAFAAQLWIPSDALIKRRVSLQRAPVCSPSSLGAGPQTCHAIAVCLISPPRKSPPTPRPPTRCQASEHPPCGAGATPYCEFVQRWPGGSLIWGGTWRHSFNGIN